MNEEAYFQKPNAGIAHVMVDLETMGTMTTAPILTIGAVIFNPFQTNTYDQLQDRAFYRVIDIEDSIKWCPHLESGTLKWWLTQKTEVLKELVSSDAIFLKNALTDLANYCTDRSTYSPLPKQYRPTTPPAKLVWAKSPDFDCKIIQNACKAVSINYPFHYSNHRCVRTAIDMAFPDPDSLPNPSGDAHNARDDAVNQAINIQQAYKQLGLHP
jgi:exodeoxyribonuclease VIII